MSSSSSSKSIQFITKIWYDSGSPREKIQEELKPLSDTCFQFIDEVKQYQSFDSLQKSVFSNYSENCLVVHFMSINAKSMFITSEVINNTENISGWRQSYTIKDLFYYKSNSVKDFSVPITFQTLIRVNYNKNQSNPWEFSISGIVIIDKCFSWKNSCDKHECSVFRKLVWAQICEKSFDLYCERCNSNNKIWNMVVSLKAIEHRTSKKPKKEKLIQSEKRSDTFDDNFESSYLHLIAQPKPCDSCFPKILQ